MAHEQHTEVLIIGGGLGGVAAALAAARLGRRVVLVEETDWLGGQLTAQAVPPDENAWIETVVASSGYDRLRRGIRDYYRRHYPLTPAAAAVVELNPGMGFVSRLCAEPRVAVAVIDEMLAPWIAADVSVCDYSTGPSAHTSSTTASSRSTSSTRTPVATPRP